MNDRRPEDVRLRHRATKDDARLEGDVKEGGELPAPDFEGESGVSDLGAAEPQVTIDGDVRDSNK